jgi:mevalonate kinase
MRTIAVSAPGKLHLLGEHVVVYGKPALLAAINKRIFVTISETKKKKIDDLSLEELKKVIENAIKKKYRISKIRPYTISISSHIPIASGLGSSAALSVALTFALLTFLGIKANKTTIFDIAYTGESFFHGNPSGGDVATVIEGGFLWYRKDFEFLKIFSPLPFKPHKNIGQFILINSGKPKESTKDMVEKVAQFKIAFPQKTQALFNSQEELTKQMVIALKEGDQDCLIECIKLGERNLEKLGVVGRKAQSLVRMIEKLGGAAKITGGGGFKEGSGMLLVYHKDMERLLSFAKQKYSEVLKIQIGTEGLSRG